MDIDKPLLGVSTCLLGEAVRYDGGHKLDRFVRDMLGKFVEYESVCPEVECGLTIPREAMRLVGAPDEPRLVTQKSEIDHTDRMQQWAVSRIEQLKKLPLCGYVFKSKSPSSGMERVKVYDHNGVPTKTGVGVFARAFMEAFPLLPVEEEGRLNDAVLRENFIECVFACFRWRQVVEPSIEVKTLQNFHAHSKYLLMSHKPAAVETLGKLVANANKEDLESLKRAYFAEFMRAMKTHATIKKHANVLQHILGYFKNELTSEEKQEMLDLIDAYHERMTTLVVPMTLINHYVKKYDKPYLRNQYYLNPHPAELQLRNHA